jgi:signal transduction histidine kinase
MAKFLSDLAHEMRGSLNAVMGFTDLLYAGAYGELNPEQLQAAADIMLAGQKLRNMVDGALDIARLETGRLVIEPEVLSVRSTAELAAGDVADLARDRLVEVRVDVPENLAVWADEARTRQILMQLLRNAVKYSAEGGLVVVTGTAVQDNAQVAITDTGVGIAPEQQELVFEDFVSLDATDSPEAGIGLGLALARRLARAMAGDIAVCSAPSSGATFVVCLPRRDPPTD